MEINKDAHKKLTFDKAGLNKLFWLGYCLGAMFISDITTTKFE